MLTDLQTAVTTISSEDLESLFAEPTPNPNEVKVEDPNKVDPKNPKIGGSGGGMDVPIIENLDEILNPEEGTAGTSGTAGNDSTAGTAGTSAQADTSGTSGTAATAGTEGSSGTSAADVANNEQVSEILTNTVKFLVEKGLFKDFEGRDGIKFTEDVYADLVEQQIEALVNERYGTKKKSAGEYGEAILDYIEKGGDADQVIDLFKEQKAIQEFDISSEDAQKELVSRYYKELGWKADRIKKTVETLASAEGELETEASEIKEKYEAHYKQQLRQLREEQDEFEQEQKRRQQAFEDSISNTVDKAANLDETRKKLIKDSMFKQKKLPNGAKATPLAVRLAQIQSSPEEYVEYIEFAMDKEGYLRRKELEFQNKAVDSKFKFVKGGAAVDKNRGSSHIEPPKEEQDKKYIGTNFKFALK